MRWVEQEKQALVATLRAADPSAPTLDEGWDVRRLVAHLVQREQRPVAGITDAAARKPPGHEPGLDALVRGAMTPEGYQKLIDRFVAGPPAWSPMSWASEKINLVEYVIHHEDVRRGGPAPAEPRVLPENEQQAIWTQVALVARLGLRKSPVGVHLATPGGEHRVVRKGAGVSITGDPVELALYVSGRRDAAQVAVTGPDELVGRFTSWVATS